MKKVALVFVLAVFVPSLLLACLAVRSLRDQQFLLERQQSLLYQGVADALAAKVQEALADQQHDFALKVTALLRDSDPRTLARSFDNRLCQDWPLAQVGFAVTTSGELLSPSLKGRPEARAFYTDNARFLANRESVEVYLNPKQAFNNAQVIAPPLQSPPYSQASLQPDPNRQSQAAFKQEPANPPAENNQKLELRNVIPQRQSELFQNSLPQRYRSQQAPNPAPPPVTNAPAPPPTPARNEANPRLDQPSHSAPPANASPQPPAAQAKSFPPPEDNQQQLSKISASEAEFRQLIGDDNEGTLARFVDNKLSVLFWCRPPSNPGYVFGAQLALPRLANELRTVLEQVEPALRQEICLALLNDAARPVALSQPNFRAAWKRPFVATEIGESLPHWEVAIYLLNPAKLTQSAHLLKLTLGWLIVVLLLAIGIGGWLIVADLNRQLTLARQKTDFVSNVSHELKTPLTSIRMFSELLAEGRVTDRAKQRSYLGIITAETARLTRLINNVLDFARIERGEKKYNFQLCDLVSVVRETTDSYRPHLETNGFQFACDLPAPPLFVHGDRDALAQVVVNLLSNAEKYSDTRKEITLSLNCPPPARPTCPTSPTSPTPPRNRPYGSWSQRRLKSALRPSMNRENIQPPITPPPCVEVRVLDRGLGVPPGCGEKIFEQFYRAHDSLSNGIQGSGLGLTLARQIARAHGGDVLYEPRDGGGSCFTLRLPLITPNTSP